ncbi:isoleucyl-tRNA synthetase [Nadsonia fulvescens var. elongata DSM 6958]|uniref:Isoleucine--tRNA ligase, mitochondrial n=1 Tax=Nadsonia fulvescens var. elongata DSM 6958 TaxID=857566 RepID=A0A1E3PK96_9ASCO|nr:isoleucyl-tRNA synthetase [Nadsonia fulvescens var. elongata DSM 6958]
MLRLRRYKKPVGLLISRFITLSTKFIPVIKAGNNRVEDADVHKYSKTLKLPKTKFANRPNHKINETIYLPQISHELYKWQSAQNTRKPFVFHDGPPYANGQLHLGHAMNKVLKDIITRYQVLNGKRVSFIPGWDCHGLPIELKALETLRKKLKVDPATILPVQAVRSIAQKHAETAVENQRADFKKWAIMGDWENAYKTFTIDYEVRQLNLFKKMVSQGYISRQNKPVYWGYETRTALAESELEYNESHVSTSVYVRFPMISFPESLHAKLPSRALENVSALIWTTTPWTLAANKAISVNPDFNYTIINTTSFGKLIVATDRVNDLLETIHDSQRTDIIFSGSDLVGSTYSNLLVKEETLPILSADYVSAGSGTGLVHNAPGHGMDDYLVCKKADIAAFSPVDDSGCYTSDLPAGCESLSGKMVLKEGQIEILNMLERCDALVSKNDKYKHSYPYDWRSKKPIIVRATSQWFANVDAIKAKAIKSLENVKFYPSSGLVRLTSFVNSRAEWCISRQRGWGVPIPALYHIETNEALLTEESVAHIINRIEKLGINQWFEPEDDVEEWLTGEFKGQGKFFKKGTETMDVWFDSGTSWTLLEKLFGDIKGVDKALADVYLEGSDQHRGWFQSSLMTRISSSESCTTAPFDTVITHGFLLDEKGIKQSKSIGNVIAPESIIKGSNNIPGLGVDGLRLWVAHSEYTSDVTVGPTVLKHVGEMLRKIRITFKYLLGNLEGFDPMIAQVEYSKMSAIDKYALHQLHEFSNTCKQHYDEYAFNKVIQAVSNHMNVSLSSFYFDSIKDHLYSDSITSTSRRSIQTVLYEVLRIYLSVLAPVLPFLAQETFMYLSPAVRAHLSPDATTPFHLGWYQPKSEWLNESLQADFTFIRDLNRQVQLLMDQARKTKQLGSSLRSETLIFISPTDADSKMAKRLQNYRPILADIFVCSDVRVSISTTPDLSAYEWSYYERKIVDGVEISLAVVPPMDRDKCLRCWKHTAPKGNDLCKRCDDVIHEANE